MWYACTVVSHKEYQEHKIGVSIVDVGYKGNNYLHNLDDEDELSLPRPLWGHYLASPPPTRAARQDSGPMIALAMIVRPILLVVGNYFLNIFACWHELGKFLE